MSVKTKTLLDAVRAGETTDPGAMTTTRDVTDVVPASYERVEGRLRALEREGRVESKLFGDRRVWVVPDEENRRPASRPIPTTTREPMAD
jgi:hypothetical protein